MKIKIDIYKLAAYDLENVIQFGPIGSSRLSKLGWYVDNVLLPMPRQDILNLFPDGLWVMSNELHKISALRTLIIKSLENIFEAEFKAGKIKGQKPGKQQLKNIATKFIPFMYADIRNATIEYYTKPRRWRMKKPRRSA